VQDTENNEIFPEESFYGFDVINKYLIYLPIKENFEDERTPSYITSTIADPLEHFIHHPQRTLSEYGLTESELRSADWHALNIMWQRMLFNLKRVDIAGVYIGKDGWGFETEEGVEFIPFDFDINEIPAPEEYDPERSKDPDAIKEDYLQLRRDLVKKVGRFNSDDPKFGLPENLFD